MATQSVKIPVELEIQKLQSSINTLQAAFNKVKPGTKIYENISKQLEKAKKDFLSLQVASEKAFSNTTEVTKFEKNFEKVTDEIAATAKMLEQLDFDSLDFSAEDLKGIQVYKDRISEINKELGNIKTDALKQLYANSQDLQETFKELSLNINTTSLDKAVKDVSTKTKQIRKQVEGFSLDILGKEAERDKAAEEMASLEKLKDTVKNLTDQQFFKSNKTFKNTQAFKDWLKNLGLDQESIDKLVSEGAKNMSRIYPEIEKAVQAAISKKSTTISNDNKNLVSLEAKRAAEQVNLNKYESSLEQLEGIEIDPKLAQQIQALQEEAEQSRLEIEKLKQELIETKGPAKDAGEAVEDLTGNLEEVHNKSGKAAQGIGHIAEATEKINNIKNAIKQWFGFNEIINISKNAVRGAITHIQELDDVMTQIAIVTDMSQKELWGQINTYSDMARQYGSSIKGVYEVSQLYYQQGLQTNDVIKLTTETLKMAKIANLEYSDATDYMTVALRGFKLEMSSAAVVNDVYSALAAATASETKELAVAMSKTASSAEAVGSSFESTSAMIATMISITREAPENIGSALKSIISRYGEMTTNPDSLVDSEGEVMSLNKVDKALQSVGISLHDANNQFRDFDDVILELSQSWDQIDTNTQRYIATIMAGNRQQSRFLALVGNYDEYAKALDVAENAEGAGTLQALKTMDSLSSKWEQFKVSVQEFYTSSGLEELLKGALDLLTRFISQANDIPKLFGTLPLSVLSMAGNFIVSLKKAGNTLVDVITKPLTAFKEKLLEIENKPLIKVKIEAEADVRQLDEELKKLQEHADQNSIEVSQEKETEVSIKPKIEHFSLSRGKDGKISEAQKKDLQKLFNELDKKDGVEHVSKQIGKKRNQWSNLNGLNKNTLETLKGLTTAQREAMLAGKDLVDVVSFANYTMPPLADSFEEATKKSGKFKNALSKTGKVLKDHSGLIGVATSSLAAMFSVMGEEGSLTNDRMQGVSGWFNIAAGTARVFLGDLSGILQIISGIGPAIDAADWTIEEQLNYASKQVEILGNNALEAQNKFKTLDSAIKEMENLKEERYDSAEAAEAYQKSVDSLAQSYPELITGFDAMGNAIIDANQAELSLINSRKRAADAAIEATQAEIRLNDIQREKIWQDVNLALSGENKEFSPLPNDSLGAWDSLTQIGQNLEDALLFGELDLDIPSVAEDFLKVQKENAINQIKENEIAVKRYSSILEQEQISYDNLKYIFEDLLASDQEIPEQLRNYLLVGSSEQGYLSSNEEGKVFFDSEKVEKTVRETDEIIQKMDALADLGLSGELTEEDLSKFKEEALTYISNNPFTATAGVLRDFLGEDGLGAIFTLMDELALNAQKGEALIKKEIKDVIIRRNPEIENTFIESSPQLFALLQDQIFEEFNAAKERGVYATTEGYLYSEEGAKFSADLQDTYSSFWISLSQEEQERFNLAIENYSSYTADEFEKILEDFNLTTEDGIGKSLWNNYSETAEKIREQFINKIYKYQWENEDWDKRLNFVTDATKKFAPEYLLEIANQYAKIAEYYPKLTEPFINFYNELMSEDLPSDLQSIISKADFTTLGGIYDFLEEAEDFGIVETDVREILDNIDINFNTEWELFIQKQLESAEELSKAISSATEGMDLEEAYKMANKLGITLEDMELIDGKFFYENAEAIISAYGGVQENYRKTLIGETEKEIKSIENQIEQLAEEEIIRGKNNSEQISNLEEQKTALTSQVEETSAEIDKYFEQQINLALLSAGFFKDFLIQTGLSEEDFNNILSAIQNNDSSSLEGPALEIYNTYYNALQDVVISSTKDVFDSMINSIEEGRNARIDITNLSKTNSALYERLKNTGNVVLSSDKKEEYLEFNPSTLTEELFKELLEESDLTLKEQNQLFIDYYSAKRKDTVGALESILSNNKEVDLADIGKLADSLDTTIERLLEDKIFTLNEDGSYTTNLDKLKAELADNVTDINSRINDAIINNLNETVDLIEEGIEGSLSYTGLDELRKTLGTELSYDYTATAEGIRFTKEATIEIYEKLSQINELSAKVVLENFAESLMDADEQLNDIFYVIERINEIEKETDDNKKNQYKGELAVLKEIEKQIKANGEAYNFMARDLPSAMNNPLSAWEGMGEAFKILDGDDFKANRISYQDFYNMITMMGDEVLLNSEIFGEKATTAANILENAAAALVNVDGETFVNLNKIGINFNVGAEGMKKGLTEGIHTLAENQIDLLDAQIALLETVVASEKIYKELDSSTDGTISLEEFTNNLFPEVDGTLTINKNLEVYQALLERGEQELIKINGETYSIKTALEALEEGSNEISGYEDEIIEALWNASLGFLADYDWLFQDTWTVNENGSLYKDGLEIKLPPINFVKDEEGNSVLDATLNNLFTEEHSALAESYEKFKETLTGKTFTLQDFISFAQDDGVSQDLIDWFISQKDSILQAFSNVDEEAIGMGITITPEYKYLSSTGFEYDNAEDAIYASKVAEVGKKIALGEVTVNPGITVSGETYTYQGVTYYSIEDLYAALTPKTTEDPTYGTNANLEITPAKIYIKVENEEEGLVAEEVETVKVTANSVEVTPKENSVIFSEELNPTIASMKAVVTALTIEPEDSSLAEGVELNFADETGEINCTISQATIEALSEDGVITQTDEGFILNGSVEELKVSIAELETPANLVDNGDGTYTLSGTEIKLSADIITALSTEEGILSETEEGYTLNGKTTAEAGVLINSLISGGLLEPDGNGAYTFSGTINQISADITGDPKGLQDIIDTYDNTDITLNVDIKVNEGSSILSNFDNVYKGLNNDFFSGWVVNNRNNITELYQYLTAIKDFLSTGGSLTTADLTALQQIEEILPTVGDWSLGTDAEGNVASLKTIFEDIQVLTQTDLSNTENNSSLVTTLTTIADLPFEEIIQAIIDLTTNSTAIADLDFSNATTFLDSLISATSETGTVNSGLESIKQKLEALAKEEGYQISLSYSISSSSETEGVHNITLNDEGAVETLTSLALALNNLNTQANTLITSANSITENGPKNVSALKTAMNKIPSNAASKVSSTANAMNRLQSRTITAKIVVSATAEGMNYKPIVKTIDLSKSKGNVALAKGTGKAAAKGKTLMGELGPELVVSNGRYFTVGNNGAEFVDLPEDAIVFNHLQTKKLLGAGGTVGTGEPVTNERNAVAFASGNVSGPAMASAESALSELKAIRAMWQALLDSSASELGKKAGSGGGGGGGGSGEDDKAYIHDLERWYNLLRQIEKLEQQITYEQAKRENMRSGYDYSESLQDELDLLRKQCKAYEDLSRLQKDFYDKRRQDLLSTDYAKIFTYDEDGLMQYVDGKNRGLDILATLNATDQNGKAKYTAKQQLAYLKGLGFDTSVFDTNVDGTKADSDEQRVQNFWDGVDSWMAELDELYDSYNEAATDMENATQAMNEILQEYIDNQLAVEEKLLKAIEDREQAEIDRIQDEKDALQEAADEYISGLNDALANEEKLYNVNETNAETAKLQRQLAILQRSGGSAAEIRALQDQLDSRLKDAYFQEQQDQIDAIQEASNNQLEKMQEQIDLMKETLEYQKENGLLWNEVYQMMNNWTPEAMLQFIQEYTKDYQADSLLQKEEADKETLKQLEMWDADKATNARDLEWFEYYEGLTDYDEETKNRHEAGARAAFNEAYKTGGKEAAIQAANDYYKKATTLTEEVPDVIIPSDNSSSSSTKKTSTSSGSGGGSSSGGSTKYQSSSTIKEAQVLLNRLGSYGKLTTDGILGPATQSAVKKFQKDWGGLVVDGIPGAQTIAALKKAYEKRITGNKTTVPKFAKGGLVNFTGPAWVDGTKTKPEAFLSAEDTAMLKSKIFSNSDGSLKALVAALEAITNNTSKYSAQTNTESIIIQNAQVNIQTEAIANDYDARRAGEKALEEMVRIARKTSNRVTSR